MSLPFINPNDNVEFTEIDTNIINDVNNVMQLFLRNGERSNAVKPISSKDNFDQVFLTKYGAEFTKVINLVYEQNATKFRLSDIIYLKNSFIVSIFKYDDKSVDTKFHYNFNDLDEILIKELGNHKISSYLTSNRIIKLYPEENTIVFIKPNQIRYWIPLIAYRDADKYLSDLSKIIN